MPYKVLKRGSRYVVVKSDTGKAVPGGSHGTKEAAERHKRALYAHVPDAKKRKK